MYEKEVKVIKKLDNSNCLVSCPKDKCSACKSKMFCNAKDSQFTVLTNNEDIKEGEEVLISMSFFKTMLSLFLVFGLPLLLMIALVLLAYFLKLEQNLQALFSLLGLALGFIIQYLINRFFLKDRLKPIITNIQKK